MFLSSIHAGADNCTVVLGNAETVDCLPFGSVPTDTILRNRAWLATHLNGVAGTSFKIPSVPVPPSFDTSKPHTGYPEPVCHTAASASAASAAGDILFCDGFDSKVGDVPHGLWQWQRNQTYCFFPQPWNTTFIPEWGTDPSIHRGHTYGAPAGGNGYAYVVPKATSALPAAMTSKAMATTGSSGAYTLSYFYKGQTSVNSNSSQVGSTVGVTTPARISPGFFVEYTIDKGATFKPLFNVILPHKPTIAWANQSHTLPSGEADLLVRFSCVTADEDASNFCAIDLVVVQGTGAEVELT